ncbi:MAG TPA: MFS transporter, partial [Synergistales bacterium]|nr:MFS transporter [Synergistales bacterium]
LAILCYLLIRNTPGEMGFPPVNEAQRTPGSDQMEKPDLSGALKEVMSKWQVWPAFVFFGFFSGAYLAFAGAWGVSYLTEVYGMDKGSASAIVSFAIYGAMAGSFFTGWISDRLGLRKLPLLIMGSLFTLGWGILVFYNGGMPPAGILQPLFFFMGFTGSCFILSWAITKEINPPRYTGISISVVNTGGFLGTAIVTTLMGVVIDKASGLAPLVQFHRAFLLCFAGCVIGLLCAFLLPETRCMNIYRKAE